ncbi:MAG TPA: hypothetical protein PK514_06015 [Spirochaetota bacterium]|nr:hypothetical protein [Spirochaetota bacterium]
MKNNSFKPASVEAYWITPDGVILPVVNTHIDMIFDNPLLFGLTEDYIYTVYDGYNEAYRIEGNARREILIDLFKKGWIRARKYHRPYRWTINVFSVTDYSASILKKFASALIEKGHSLYDEVLLDTWTGRGNYILEDLQGDIKSIPIDKILE